MQSGGPELAARAGSTYGSLVRHTSLRRALHVLDVLVERAAGEFVRRRLPGGAAFRQFAIGEGDVDAVLVGVDRDPVTVVNEGDRTAFLSFGRDVADDEAVRAAGEASVGHERDLMAEAGSDDGRGRSQHFGHAGATFRTFEADDHDVTLLDAAFFERVQHVFFGREATGWAAEF